MNRIQKRNAWSDINAEENLRKLARAENFFNEVQSMNLDNDQIDGHPGGLQKRGRQCLWKVCSWALDKRTPVDPANKFGSILY